MYYHEINLKLNSIIKNLHNNWKVKILKNQGAISPHTKAYVLSLRSMERDYEENKRNHWSSSQDFNEITPHPKNKSESFKTSSKRSNPDLYPGILYMYWNVTLSSIILQLVPNKLTLFQLYNLITQHQTMAHRYFICSRSKTARFEKAIDNV